jgi:hypothetical protein
MYCFLCYTLWIVCEFVAYGPALVSRMPFPFGTRASVCFAGVIWMMALHAYLFEIGQDGRFFGL